MIEENPTESFGDRMRERFGDSFLKREKYKKWGLFNKAKLIASFEGRWLSVARESKKGDF